MGAGSDGGGGRRAGDALTRPAVQRGCAECSKRSSRRQNATWCASDPSRATCTRALVACVRSRADDTQRINRRAAGKHCTRHATTMCGVRCNTRQHRGTVLYRQCSGTVAILRRVRGGSPTELNRQLCEWAPLAKGDTNTEREERPRCQFVAVAVPRHCTMPTGEEKPRRRLFG